MSLGRLAFGTLFGLVSSANHFVPFPSLTACILNNDARRPSDEQENRGECELVMVERAPNCPPQTQVRKIQHSASTAREQATSEAGPHCSSENQRQVQRRKGRVEPMPGMTCRRNSKVANCDDCRPNSDPTQVVPVLFIHAVTLLANPFRGLPDVRDVTVRLERNEIVHALPFRG